MSKGSRSFLRHPAALSEYFTVKQVAEFKQGLNLVIADIESVEMKNLDTGRMETKIAVHFKKWDQSWIPSKTMLQELGEVFDDNWDNAIGEMINLHAAKTGNPKFPLALRFRTATGKATPVDVDPMDQEDETDQGDQEAAEQYDDQEEETDAQPARAARRAQRQHDQEVEDEGVEESEDEEQGRQPAPQRRQQRQAAPPARRPAQQQQPAQRQRTGR
jgi:hypothetical protein